MNVNCAHYFLARSITNRFWQFAPSLTESGTTWRF